MLYNPSQLPSSTAELKTLIKKGKRLPRAVDIYYPSRGQTTVQELYETSLGKLFLKRTSDRNHKDCQIDPKTGTLAEREFWCHNLAKHIGLEVPSLKLLDKSTTVQIWLSINDAFTYSSTLGKMTFNAENVFECAIFDWVTGQIDRHNANYLYDYTRKKIILIDSAFSLLKRNAALPHYLELYEFSGVHELDQPIQTVVTDRLKELTHTKLLKLIPLKTEAEKTALIKRHEKILSTHTLREVIQLYRR